MINRTHVGGVVRVYLGLVKFATRRRVPTYLLFQGSGVSLLTVGRSRFHVADCHFRNFAVGPFAVELYLRCPCRVKLLLSAALLHEVFLRNSNCNGNLPMPR